MDALDKCYIWHIITLAKMKLNLKELKGGEKNGIRKTFGDKCKN